MRVSVAAALLLVAAVPRARESAAVPAFVVEWTTTTTMTAGAERIPAQLLLPPILRERWTCTDGALRREALDSFGPFQAGTAFLHHTGEALVTVLTPDATFYRMNPDRLPLPRWELVRFDTRDPTRRELLGYSARAVHANLVLTARGTDWWPKQRYAREIGVTAEIWMTEALPHRPALVRAALGSAGVDVPTELIDAVSFPLAVKLTMIGGPVQHFIGQATSLRKTTVVPTVFEVPAGSRQIPNPIDQLLDKSRQISNQ